VLVAECSTLYPLSNSDRDPDQPTKLDESKPLGVALLELESRSVHYRIRQDLDTLFPDVDMSSLESLKSELERLASKEGGEVAFSILTTTGWRGIQGDVPERREIHSISTGLAAAYRVAVGPVPILKFQTHLPLYSLKSAAGLFLDNYLIKPLGWVEIPDARTLTDKQFVVLIVGHSMEPQIPDGSYVIVEKYGAGSRVGRLVLVEERGKAEMEAYTLKKYSRQPLSAGDATNRRTPIILKSVNPDFEDIQLDPEEEDSTHRILGFYVATYGPELMESADEEQEQIRDTSDSANDPL
jgi:SOS-response transcriptional repressor LexA